MDSKYILQEFAPTPQKYLPKWAVQKNKITIFFTN